jgi:hypothetical protein
MIDIILSLAIILLGVAVIILANKLDRMHSNITKWANDLDEMGYMTKALENKFGFRRGRYNNSKWEDDTFQRWDELLELLGIELKPTKNSHLIKKK